MKHKSTLLHLVLVVLLTWTVVWLGLLDARAQSPNRAGIVVRFGDGSVVTRCVEFSEAEITGYDLLQRSGLAIEVFFDAGQGVAVCKIEHQGCPISDCFCAYPPDFWSYWLMTGGQWQFSPVGAGSRSIKNGDVDGWSWGAGTDSSGTEPPLTPFDQICAPPPAPPTDTPIPPTATPVPLPPTPIPPTPAPTSTLEPMVWFRLDHNPVPAGSCTMVRWDTDALKELYLDGEVVGSNGAFQTCPTEHQRFTLRVVTLGGDEQTHVLELGVTGGTATSRPAPTAQVVPTAAATLPLSTATAAPSPAPPTEALSQQGQGGATKTETPRPSPTTSLTPPPERTSTVQVEPTHTVISTPAQKNAPPTLTQSHVAVASVSEDVPPAALNRGKDVSASSSQQASKSTLNYIFFGALVVILVAALIALWVRRRQFSTTGYKQ